MAFVAQLLGPNGELSHLDAPGIGNVADLGGLSVKERKELIAGYCSGDIPPIATEPSPSTTAPRPSG